MSTSLLKRALELFSEDSKSSEKKSQQILKCNSTHRRGVKRLKQPIVSVTAAAKNQASVKDRKVASSLDKYKKKHKKEDHTEANLAALAKFDGSFSSVISSEKIVQRFQRNKLPSRSELFQSKDDRKCKNKEATSAFTEEDFATFEKEYFVKV